MRVAKENIGPIIKASKYDADTAFIYDLMDFWKDKKVIHNPL